MNGRHRPHQCLRQKVVMRPLNLQMDLLKKQSKLLPNSQQRQMRLSNANQEHQTTRARSVVDNAKQSLRNKA